MAAPRADGVPEPNKLEILCAYTTADVYELIDGLDSYDAAIAKLKASFIKTPNVIFSRHQLATRKQKAGESLEEFLQALHVLSKDCSLRNISAEQYRLDLVRDAFINGVASYHIRQRLLESNELIVNQAFNKARSLFQAQEYSATYTSRTNSVAASATRTEDNSENEADIDSSPVTSGEVLAVATFSGERKCYYCGRRYHCRADRLGKTGADGAHTSSSWASTSLSLMAVVVLSLLWASTNGWVSFVSVLSSDSSEAQGDQSFKETVTSPPLRWQTFA